MENRQYKIRYLPSFESDLLDTVRYIDEVLQNPNAADHLIDAVEDAIIKKGCITSPLWTGEVSFCSFAEHLFAFGLYFGVKFSVRPAFASSWRWPRPWIRAAT